MKDAVKIDGKGDSVPDILTGGNYFAQAIEIKRNDANFGTVLINKGKGEFVAESINGVLIKNQISHILPIRIDKNTAYIIARNNDAVMVIK